MLIYLIFFSKVYYKVYSTRSLTIVRKCLDVLKCWRMFSLQRRHNERDGVSNHHTHDCLLKRLFRRRSKKTSKLRVTGLCAGNSPMTGEFPAQTASNAEKVSIDDVIMYFFICLSIIIVLCTIQRDYIVIIPLSNKFRPEQNDDIVQTIIQNASLWMLIMLFWFELH